LNEEKDKIKEKGRKGGSEESYVGGEDDVEK
jgi:general stress protein YciG